MNYLSSPVFILGHPKSGTSLLTSLLDSHPQLMVLPEESDYYSITYPAVRALNIRKNIPVDFKKSILARNIFEISHLRNFFRGKTEEDISGNFDYTHLDKEAFKNYALRDVLWTKIDSRLLLLNIIRAYATAVYSESNICAFKYWVEKTPKHIYSLRKIKGDFPNAKFIFIYRDPRDNYISCRKKYGERITATGFSYQWNKCLHIAECVAGMQILFLKYEDLLIHPDEQINNITNFLGIKKHASLYQPSKMGIEWCGNSMFKEKKHGIDSTHLGRYKTLITKKDQLTIEALCKQKMLKYKYAFDLKREFVPVTAAYGKILTYYINSLFTVVKETFLRIQGNLVLQKNFSRK